ncbi:hypothetical protein B0H10DRAFT_2224235 [Mycena sp. CBHHK59/15]|nr:hypothetical protein B0H10DRAFT_2224235 [Mycena sp. CBHHK59/15]
MACLAPMMIPTAPHRRPRPRPRQRLLLLPYSRPPVRRQSDSSVYPVSCAATPPSCSTTALSCPTSRLSCSPAAPPPAHSYSRITPHLSISDLAFAEDPAALRAHAITHVVSVLPGRVHIPPCIPRAHTFRVPLADAPFAELVGALPRVVRWVADVLVRGGVLGVEEVCGILGVDAERGPDADARGKAVFVADSADGGRTRWSGGDDGSMGGDDGHGGGATHDDGFEGADERQPPQTPHILIHCAHGLSRSPAVCAALLVALPLVEWCDVDLGDDLTVPDLGALGDTEFGGLDAHDVKSGIAHAHTQLRSLGARIPAYTMLGELPADTGNLPPVDPLVQRPSTPHPQSAAHPVSGYARTTRLPAPLALAHVQRARPAARVNEGFKAQVGEWGRLVADA